MSKTKKDRPYDVRAAEARKGIKRHYRWCNGIDNSVEEFVKTETHIFHANEVRNMEALVAEVEEKGGAFKVTEKSGYLVTYNPNVWRFYGTAEEPHVREKVVDLQVGGIGDARYYSNWDVFYIYEVTYKIPNKHFGEECCEPTLPKSMTSKNGGCSCCVNHKPEDRTTDIRAELENEVKKANSR